LYFNAHLYLVKQLDPSLCTLQPG